MREYPEIPYWNKGIFGKPVIGFEKLDGQLFRAEYSRKHRGFTKFGSKNMMVDASHPEFGQAVRLFKLNMADALTWAFIKKYRESERFVVFCEYWGEYSFNGMHKPDDHMNITLFDVMSDRGDILHPREFIDNFGHLDIPRILYVGNYNKEMIERVRQGKMEGNPAEGLVCKGVNNGRLWMAKVKTNDWLRRYRKLKGDDELTKELNGDRSLLDG